jgi:hypothetical protein
MSPPVSNSAYGSERDIHYASHGETAENHGEANEVANDNDSDDGIAILSRLVIETRLTLYPKSHLSCQYCHPFHPFDCHVCPTLYL